MQFLELKVIYTVCFFPLSPMSENYFYWSKFFLSPLYSQEMKFLAVLLIMLLPDVIIIPVVSKRNSPKFKINKWNDVPFLNEPQYLSSPHNLMKENIALINLFLIQSVDGTVVFLSLYIWIHKIGQQEYIKLDSRNLLLEYLLSLYIFVYPGHRIVCNSFYTYAENQGCSARSLFLLNSAHCWSGNLPFYWE